MDFWTDDRVDRLKGAILAKLSAREAGLQIGCTGCAAIGKARRLGLAFSSDRKRTCATARPGDNAGVCRNMADSLDERRRLASLERDWRLTA